MHHRQNAGQGKRNFPDTPPPNGHAAALKVAPDGDAEAARIIVRLVCGRHVSLADLASLPTTPFDWSGLASVLSGTADVGRRAAEVRRWLDGVQGYAPPGAVGQIRLALQGAEADPPDDEPGAAPAGPMPFDLGLVETADFFAQDFPMKFLAKSILLDAEPCVLGGPSKSLKTSLLIDLAISLASGTPFLGRFEVPEPVPVALISGESGRRVIQLNAKQVCVERNLPFARAAGVRWGFVLPQLSSDDHLDVLKRAIDQHGLRVIMIDPLYLSLLAGSTGIDASNMFHMGPLLAKVGDICTSGGATAVLCHHSIKRRENPRDPLPMDDLAFSGVGQWMRQWILISRRDPFDAESGIHRLHMGYGGSAGHAGELHLEIETGRIDDDLKGRRWIVRTSTPSESITDQQTKAREEKEIREAAKLQEAEARKARTRDTNAGKVVEAIRALAKKGKAATRSALREHAGLSSADIGIALALLEDQGRIEQYIGAAAINNGTTRPVDAYRMAGSGPAESVTRDNPYQPGINPEILTLPGLERDNPDNSATPPLGGADRPGYPRRVRDEDGRKPVDGKKSARRKRPRDGKGGGA